MESIINYDTEFCGRVPLNQTNLIQPHGVLLIVRRHDLRVVQASENVVELLGLQARDVVETPLAKYVSENQLKQLTKKASAGLQGNIPLMVVFNDSKHLTYLKLHEQYFIMEIELEARNAQNDHSFVSIYQDLKYVMAAIDASENSIEIFNIAISELKRVSGFDKIMVYRFDENWNGDVIAEVKEDGMDSYLGLKFPASDIPKQARELYKKTPYRLIPNANYEPVRVYPVINPITNSFLDLSDSNLRSVAGVHLEYLRNMGVVASMSTRVLKDNRLWGLIACHHRSARYLSFEMCSVFELVSNIVSVKIASIEKEEAYQYKSHMQELYADVMEEVYRVGNLPGAFSKQGNLILDLLSAGGATVCWNGSIHSIGQVPSGDAVQELVFWLQSKNVGKSLEEVCLSAQYEPALEYTDVGSGLLALPIQPEKGNYILAFRPEVVRQVNWGGNPNEAVNFEADRVRYHPRNSFMLWQQTVEKTAIAWKPEEIEMAEHFRNFVLEFTLNKIYS